MPITVKSKPVILSLSGHDPSGGAGIQADIEAIHAQGCHAATIITCLTVQDTKNVYRIEPVSADLILQQTRAVMDDMPINALKVGLMGSLENVSAIQQIIQTIHQEHSDIPVVLDPVLAAGGGNDLVTQEIADALCEKLLPLTTLVTPNIPEAEYLSNTQDIDACAHYFQDKGCKYTLITGTHSQTLKVINTLYCGDEKVSETSWPRLAANYHGSGCTLASSIATGLGSGMTITKAVKLAQEYTWKSLNTATLHGGGQLIPNR